MFILQVGTLPKTFPGLAAKENDCKRERVCVCVYINFYNNKYLHDIQDIGIWMMAEASKACMRMWKRVNLEKKIANMLKYKRWY